MSNKKRKFRRTTPNSFKPESAISLEEWKRLKIIHEDKHPKRLCNDCGKTLKGSYGMGITVQRYEPTDYKGTEYVDHDWGDHDWVEGTYHDNGVRLLTNYNNFWGYGRNGKGRFCTGKCAERFAYRCSRILLKEEEGIGGSFQRGHITKFTNKEK